MKEFSALLCMGRYKSPGLLKSFLSYTSQLSKGSILGFLDFSHSLDLLSNCWGWGGGGICWITGFVFPFEGPYSHLEAPSH